MCCQNTTSCLECLNFIVKLEVCTTHLQHVRPVMIGPDSEDTVCWEPTRHTHQLVVCDRCYATDVRSGRPDDLSLRDGIFSQAKIDHAVQQLADQHGVVPYVNAIKLLAKGPDGDDGSADDDTGCRYLVPVNISLTR